MYKYKFETQANDLQLSTECEDVAFSGEVKISMYYVAEMFPRLEASAVSTVSP